MHKKGLPTSAIGKPKPQQEVPTVANRSIAQAVNRTAVARALAQARAECVGQVAWMNAINRAALNLESCW